MPDNPSPQAPSSTRAPGAAPSLPSPHQHRDRTDASQAPTAPMRRKSRPAHKPSRHEIRKQDHEKMAAMIQFGLHPSIAENLPPDSLTIRHDRREWPEKLPRMIFDGSGNNLCLDFGQ